VTAVFRCKRFPRGVVPIRTSSGTVIDFVDGVAEVDDEQLAQELRDLPATFRVVEDLPPGPDPEAVPDGTIAVVLDWVGGDPARAARALQSEQARGEQARKTLVADLEQLAQQQ
jgi:hypothetical protein